VWCFVLVVGEAAELLLLDVELPALDELDALNAALLEDDELELPTVHCAPPELEDEELDELEAEELEEVETVQVPCAY
jgi:hypothetical protein